MQSDSAPTPKTLLRISIVVALITIALKALAWWITDSVALLSDAMESGVNLVSAGFALYMVTVAARPPDDDHPYGHHKAEYFSSGFEGLMIFAAALGILIVSSQRLLSPQPIQEVGFGLLLSIISSGFNGGLAWFMLRSAKTHNSIALEADGKHLLTDVWTTAGVVLGIIGVVWTDWYWLDPLIAILVALNILREGVHLVWSSSQGLMDGALAAPDIEKLENVLQIFEKTHNLDGSLRFDHLNTRSAGQRKFADLHMHVPANWTLGRAAALRSQLEQALMEAIPSLRVSIQLLPTNVEAHLID